VGKRPKKPGGREIKFLYKKKAKKKEKAKVQGVMGNSGKRLGKGRNFNEPGKTKRGEFGGKKWEEP